MARPKARSVANIVRTAIGSQGKTTNSGLGFYEMEHNLTPELLRYALWHASKRWLALGKLEKPGEVFPDGSLKVMFKPALTANGLYCTVVAKDTKLVVHM